jgi:hypothetical protein
MTTLRSLEDIEKYDLPQLPMFHPVQGNVLPAKRCGNCTFWEAFKPSFGKTTVGECRLKPPAADPESVPRRFPKTSTDDYCGEHSYRAQFILPWLEEFRKKRSAEPEKNDARP